MRVLIVEDDPLTAVDISASLEDGGHTVVAVAESFSDAIAAVSEAPVDVAIVDIGLKDGGTGTEVVRALLRRFRIRSILISAERELRAKADQSGAIGYIPKPARPGEILRFMRGLATPTESFC